MLPGSNPMQQYSAAYAQMLGLAGFNSQQVGLVMLVLVLVVVVVVVWRPIIVLSYKNTE